MNIDIFIYYTDGKYDFCFGCAVREIMENKDKVIDVEARDHSYDGCDMRSDPKCHACGKSTEHHIIA